MTVSFEWSDITGCISLLGERNPPIRAELSLLALAALELYPIPSLGSRLPKAEGSGAEATDIKVLVGSSFMEDHGWISKSPDARA
jgi:hypothetical protein